MSTKEITYDKKLVNVQSQKIGELLNLVEMILNENLFPDDRKKYQERKDAILSIKVSEKYHDVG